MDFIGIRHVGVSSFETIPFSRMVTAWRWALNAKTDIGNSRNKETEASYSAPWGCSFCAQAVQTAGQVNDVDSWPGRGGKKSSDI
ncbi:MULTISPECIES: hypothetical protein [Pseudomonas]|uniref:hypothetical protein n=1 Tax=Pseudomonas TaxID=286 RepID=UPI0011135DC5|nr:MULTISPECIES: hypothetical protein [Pseudomonas]